MYDRYKLAKITGVESYGVFVKLDENIFALCHKKNLRKNPDRYHKGDYIWVKEIESENPDKHQAKEYSYKEKNDLLSEFMTSFSEGDIIQGLVKKVEDKLGIFITVYPGVDALFHISEYTENFSNTSVRENNVVNVRIGKIDTGTNRITLVSPAKKNKKTAVEIDGVKKDDFLDCVEINKKMCDTYRERVADNKITDIDVQKLIAESYSTAVEEDRVYEDKEGYTFQIKGKTKQGGSIAAGVRKNNYNNGKKWYVNMIGSSAKLIGNAIDLFAYVDDWPHLLNELEKKLLKGESWDYKKMYPDSLPSKKELYILKKYLNYTFYCAQNQNLVLFSYEDEKFAAFNTGLVNDVYETIYLCFESSSEGEKKKWTYSGFCTYGTGDLGKKLNAKMENPPEKVQYFNSINDMLFDTTKKLNWDKEHILIENVNRLPIEFIEKNCKLEEYEDIKEHIESIKRGKNIQNHFDFISKYIEQNSSFKRTLVNRLNDAITLAIKRCEWNYKTAIPIFYHVTNGISLLLPLCLLDDEKSADVALVVEKKKESGNYQGETILTLSMAYLDARLICRPNSEWLNPEIVMAEKEYD